MDLHPKETAWQRGIHPQQACNGQNPSVETVLTRQSAATHAAIAR
jgi:hypothetical protein